MRYAVAGIQMSSTWKLVIAFELLLYVSDIFDVFPVELETVA